MGSMYILRSRVARNPHSTDGYFQVVESTVHRKSQRATRAEVQGVVHRRQGQEIPVLLVMLKVTLALIYAITLKKSFEIFRIQYM